MALRSFTLSTSVAVGPERAVDFLMDLEHHHGLHPFLVSATVVSSGQSPDGPWWDWRVLERPALGPVHYPIRFPARLVRTSPTSIQGHVRAAPGCRLTTTTLATRLAGGTRVMESTVVRAPKPLLGYMADQAETAHRRTYERLAEELARWDLVERARTGHR